MIRFILPIVFIVAAVGLYFGYISPQYDEIKQLQLQEAQLDEALDKSRELQEIRDQLLLTYNTFTTEQLDRLQKLIPDNVDNVRLILDIASIAETRDVRIGRVDVADVEREDNGTVGEVSEEDTLGSIKLSFIAEATYDNLLLFLRDIERSLRIVDVTELSVSAGDADFAGDTSEYDISFVTYWLK